MFVACDELGTHRYEANQASLEPYRLLEFD